MIPPCTNPGSVELSVVIPVFNSANIFPELHRRLTTTLAGVVSTYEIIGVVDGARDKSFDVIQDIDRIDCRVKAMEFSRNFGHQAAVTAGLEIAIGDMVAIIDDDLEDPPEVLAAMVAKIREGFDVVYGIRRKRKRSLLHRFLFKAFYRTLSALVDLKLPGDAGDFCIMTRRIVQALNSMPENNRYLRGLRAWAGFEQTGIEYERGSRLANKSGYSFGKYIKLALDAIFAFSYKPLQYVSRIGAFIAFGSFALGFYLFCSGSTPVAPGWASLFVAILFFSGVQLLSVGIIGQHLARIYDEIKHRPKLLSSALRASKTIVIVEENQRAHSACGTLAFLA